MSLWRGRVRIWMLAWAVLQLAATPALALADGALALRNAGRVAAHIEGHSSESCQPPHSADCVLCQFVSSQVANTSTATVLAWPSARFHCPDAPAIVLGQRVTLDLSYSRAPPIA